MRKIYILDTSVLIHDPTSFRSFSGNDVIIPINVLDELDKLKTFPNEAGKNARVCIRYLDALCAKGAIHKGIKIENNILLKIDTGLVNAERFGSSSYVDNKILACAFSLKEKGGKKKIPTPVILVSKDINLRIRARAFDIHAEDYERDRTQVNDLYTGSRVIESFELGNTLITKGFLDVGCYDELQGLMPNECIHFVDQTNKNGLALGRKIGEKIQIIKSKRPWGLETRSKEQAFATELICDKKVPLVTLIGRSGTGKTLIAIANILENVLERKEYSRMIVYRPIQPVGKDLGYLPGSLSEKLEPWLGAISDTFEFLFESKNGPKWKTILDRYLDEGTIQMDAIAYIRGRSIPNAFILVDEAQNLTKEEIKTILTRAGNDTKIILTGDIEQIDNTSLDATNNGLTYVIEKFKSSPLAGHVTFTKGERSPLATLASDIL